MEEDTGNKNKKIDDGIKKAYMQMTDGYKPDVKKSSKGMFNMVIIKTETGNASAWMWLIAVTAKTLILFLLA